ncbi:hypothetical protein SAMN05421818_10218 [Myroides phaeus]|uniref:Uncharacterized protein n=1 Tax=Myroides phaeus TaxID=702745 RepID=A0A1G8BDK4_9FLAO|nr:hypothetical protein SAMN05421818_10218 [Myroides phaeus]
MHYINIKLFIIIYLLILFYFIVSGYRLNTANKKRKVNSKYLFYNIVHVLLIVFSVYEYYISVRN